MYIQYFDNDNRLQQCVSLLIFIVNSGCNKNIIYNQNNYEILGLVIFLLKIVFASFKIQQKALINLNKNNSSEIN